MEIERDFIFDPSLVLYLPLYKLDGASIMDRSAYGHLCTVTGALWRPNGHYFDGSDDRVNCGTSSAFDITDAITVELWVYVDPAGVADGKLSYLAGKSNATVSATWHWQFDDRGPPTNAFRMQVLGASIGTVLLDDYVTGANWFHLAMAYSVMENQIRAYVNSVLEGTTTFNETLNTNAFPVMLAAAYKTTSPNYQDPFAGLIGEVMIYNRALTPQEIQRNYLATKWRYR